MAGGEGEGNPSIFVIFIQCGTCNRFESLLTRYASLRSGDPLPEAAAAELHPDVPPEPGPRASDEGAESGAGEQGHGGLRGPQWQQRHPLRGNHCH